MTLGIPMGLLDNDRFRLDATHAPTVAPHLHLLADGVPPAVRGFQHRLPSELTPHDGNQLEARQLELLEGGTAHVFFLDGGCRFLSINERLERVTAPTRI